MRVTDSALPGGPRICASNLPVNPELILAVRGQDRSLVFATDVQEIFLLFLSFLALLTLTEDNPGYSRPIHEDGDHN